MDFWEIYHQYYERVRKFIFALVKDQWVADDLIQDTFVKVQKNLDQVREASKLSAWIFKIAYNLSQDHFRKTSRSANRVHVIDGHKEILTEPVFQKAFEQHQMGACIQDKIRRLPESYQVVLTLADLMECSHREIADILDLSVENVKVRLHRARRQLRKILEENCSFERDERNVLVCDPLDAGCLDPPPGAPSDRKGGE